jgi:hypothetical protein
MRHVQTVILPGHSLGMSQAVKIGANPQYYGGRIIEEGIELWVECDMDGYALEELIAIGGMFAIPPDAEHICSVDALTSRGPVVFHCYRSTRNDGNGGSAVLYT